jgi:hypothetical protein
MATAHALIIGIDRYPHLDPQYQLAGCVNDARLIRKVLEQRFGFAASAITSLHDEAASRAAILSAMQALLERVGPRDSVFFHFSGHGSRRRTDDPEQASGRASTIMPSDSGRDPLPNLDILDHEIGEWLQQLSARTGAISLLFDCCHSGTITRDPFAARVRAGPGDERDPGRRARALQASVDPDRAPQRRGGESSWQQLAGAYVVMSGCRDSEYAHEHRHSEAREGEADSPSSNGALTHFLARELLRASAGASYREVFEAARAQVIATYPQQHPQIEGSQDRELFDSAERPRLRAVPVLSHQAGLVTLDGGAAHGLVRGALWAAYSVDAVPGDGTPLAMLRIEHVGALTADARVLGDDTLAAGMRCVEHSPSTEQFRLAIDLGALNEPDRAELRALLAESALCVEATDSAGAELRIYRLAPRVACEPGQPAPQLGALREACWVVIDRSGALAMPPRACDDAQALPTLRQNLETLARYRNALRLNNPDSALAVDFRLLREDADGGWQPLSPSGESLKAGDSIAFELVNREERPVFVSVLDFGVSGRIQLLFPPNSSSELLAAGQTLRIGGGRRRIRLGFPEGFVGERGHETLKAFVSLDETDFSWLQQAGTRSPTAARTRLRRLFEAAYCGPPLRDAGFSDEGESSEDWCAPAVTFELSRD